MLLSEDFCFLNGERGVLNKIIEKFNFKIKLRNFVILLIRRKGRSGNMIGS